MIVWVQSEDIQEHSLAQVSYTLLAGRQHFDYRCAIVAGDWKEAERLWSSMDNDSSRVVPRSKVSRESGGQDLLHQAHSAKGDTIKHREILLVLADRYCQGHEFDWEKLFGEPRPQRIHLPTYPFSRQSYGGNSPVLTKTDPARIAPKNEI